VTVLLSDPLNLGETGMILVGSWISPAQSDSGRPSQGSLQCR
jgi:hypothetical protein